jgi:hypothetical protein
MELKGQWGYGNYSIKLVIIPNNKEPIAKYKVTNNATKKVDYLVIYFDLKEIAKNNLLDPEDVQNMVYKKVNQEIDNKLSGSLEYELSDCSVLSVAKDEQWAEIIS